MIDYSDLDEKLEGQTWANIQKKAGIGADTLNRIRKGEPVSLTTIQKLADLLEKSLHVEVMPDNAPGKAKR